MDAGIVPYKHRYPHRQDLDPEEPLAKLLPPSSVGANATLTLPSKWMREHLPLKDVEEGQTYVWISLEYKMWLVKVLVKEYSCMFSGGWAKFASDNSLAAGDELSFCFSHKKDEQPVMHVSLKRGGFRTVERKSGASRLAVGSKKKRTRSRRMSSAIPVKAPQARHQEYSKPAFYHPCIVRYNTDGMLTILREPMQASLSEGTAHYHLVNGLHSIPIRPGYAILGGMPVGTVANETSTAQLFPLQVGKQHSHENNVLHERDRRPDGQRTIELLGVKQIV